MQESAEGTAESSGGLVAPPIVQDRAATTSGIVRMEWHRAAYGTGIGAGGLVAADVDQDGVVEIVATAGVHGTLWNAYWHVLEWNGADYDPQWSSLPPDRPIDRLEVAQLDADAPLEIVTFGAGRVLAYDGLSLQLELDLGVPPFSIRDMAVADVDGDGSVEAVLCNWDGLWVVDLASGAVQLDVPEHRGVAVAVGETDGSTGVEIVIGAGLEPGKVVDASTGAVEWSHVLGFGDHLALGDVDGDGLDEIVAGYSSSGIEVWNGDTHSFAWGVPISYLTALTASDVEGDGEGEVLYAEDFGRRVHILEGSTGAEKWWVDDLDDPVYRLAVGDGDRDGHPEIFFGAGYGSAIGDFLFAVDGVSRSVEWRSADFEGPFYGFAHGDIDADGEPEVVYTSKRSEGFGSAGRYFVHDAATKALEYRSPSPDGSETSDGIPRIQLADVRSDAALEIFMPFNTMAGQGWLQCRDGATHELWWGTQLADGLPIASLRLGDPDRDGDIETVTALDGSSDVWPGNHVFIHDAATGVEEWQSPNLVPFFGSYAKLDLLRVADIDDDDVDEVLVAGSGGDLLTLDPVAGTVEMSTTGLAITALEVADLDHDGVPDIIVGSTDGVLSTIDPATGAPTVLGGPYGGQINGLAVRTVTNDATLDFVFCAGDTVLLVDGESMSPIWQSGELGDDVIWAVGIRDSVVVDDFDLDGVLEIWVNAGLAGHVMFEVVGFSTTIFADGFNSGNASFWVVRDE